MHVVPNYTAGADDTRKIMAEPGVGLLSNPVYYLNRIHLAFSFRPTLGLSFDAMMAHAASLRRQDFIFLKPCPQWRL